MKTLKQLQEGVVASSDYKLSSSGKRYKAHRRVMGGNPYDGISEALGYEIENKKRLKQIAATAKNAQVKGSEAKPLSFTEASDAREYDYEGDMAKSQLRSIIANSQRVHDMLKDNTNMAEWVQSKITLAADYITTVSDYMQSEVKEEVGLDEARGRPKKMSIRSDDDDSEEHEEHESDNGMEADQHIHVQLKKAADSDQKPFHVTFKNGKKYPVSQSMAKTVLNATERLKPEHRKNVHDEIHQSYDNLVSVHRLIAGK
jgi:hypothetical protein